MAELHVRNLPDELHDRLRQRAIAEGRSMSAEAVILLRRSLETNGDQSAERRATIERLHEIRRRSRVPAGAQCAEGLVREDRDRAL